MLLKLLDEQFPDTLKAKVENLKSKSSADLKNIGELVSNFYDRHGVQVIQ